MQRLSFLTAIVLGVALTGCQSNRHAATPTKAAVIAASPTQYPYRVQWKKVGAFPELYAANIIREKYRIEEVEFSHKGYAKSVNDIDFAWIDLDGSGSPALLLNGLSGYCGASTCWTQILVKQGTEWRDIPNNLSEDVTIAAEMTNGMHDVLSPRRQYDPDVVGLVREAFDGRQYITKGRDRILCSPAPCNW
ncbi:hypothetical protein ABNQ39_36045 (plasmid) [Azospirillum sp. A26]|uniref:hypothetical protein n=1 Tax=Azospirillum sp. A26 TaxID=3160607 RepID=UPI00366DA3B0